MIQKPDKILSIFLWLVALHSLLVGIGLIVLPLSVFNFLGFTSSFDRFFSMQGGVFHIAMSVCYAMSAYDIIRFKYLVLFSIIVKFMASAFLIPYYLFISKLQLIILSGISDLSIGLVIMLFYIKLSKKSFFRIYK